MESIDVLARRTPRIAYDEMIAARKTSIQDVLAYGTVNTPIILNSTGETVGYVVFWHHNNNVTAVDSDGNLLGVDEGRGYVTQAESVDIFEKYLIQQATL